MIARLARLWCRLRGGHGYIGTRCWRCDAPNPDPYEVSVYWMPNPDGSTTEVARYSDGTYRHTTLPPETGWTPPDPDAPPPPLPDTWRDVGYTTDPAERTDTIFHKPKDDA